MNTYLSSLISLKLKQNSYFVMDRMDFLMENLRPLSPLLGYAIEVATSHWTWMALVLIAFFSLWGFRGIKGFHFLFPGWRKQAQIKVMLQFFSSSFDSNHTPAGKNSTSFTNGNLSLYRNMCMDDLHLLTHRKESLNETGIYRRRFNKRNKSYSTIDSIRLCSSVETMENCVEARSASFLQTKMRFMIEKSSSLSIAKSVPSALRSGEKKLESPTSDQLMGCPPRSLTRLPKHEKLCTPDNVGGNEGRSIEERLMQDCRSEITFPTYFLYDAEYKENCKGCSSFMNDGKGDRKLGLCLLDNCVELGPWRRLVSFEIQFGWDRLQPLRLGYESNWNYCGGSSGLNFDKFSNYIVRDINVAKNLDGPARSIVKLFCLQEDVASSVDVVWNMGLSYTSTVDNNVRLWDIEVGKCLKQMVVDDHVIMGNHIENSPGFLLSGIMIREQKASSFIWDPRDFVQPLDFSVGNMLTFHSVQFNENNVCVADCFTERLFDIRTIAASSVYYAKLSSSMIEGSLLSLESTSLEDFILIKRKMILLCKTLS